MKLTRKQELLLIDIGLATLVNNLSKPTPIKKENGGAKKRKWSKERHKKYAETMAKKWNKKENK